MRAASVNAVAVAQGRASVARPALSGKPACRLNANQDSAVGVIPARVGNQHERMGLSRQGSAFPRNLPSIID